MLFHCFQWRNVPTMWGDIGLSINGCVPNHLTLLDQINRMFRPKSRFDCRSSPPFPAIRRNQCHSTCKRRAAEACFNAAKCTVQNFLQRVPQHHSWASTKHSILLILDEHPHLLGSNEGQHVSSETSWIFDQHEVAAACQQLPTGCLLPL